MSSPSLSCSRKIPSCTGVGTHPTLPSIRGRITALKTRQPRVMPPETFFPMGYHHTGPMHRSFARGPLNGAGEMCDASDRPLLCLSLSKDEEELVVGSADHALYAYNLKTCKPTRKLYSKAHGHIDWVTCVVHMDNGQVLSGGGDGKICVWPPSRLSPSSFPLKHNEDGAYKRPACPNRLTHCQDLDGHASSVSKILPVPESDMAFSGSYDGLIKLWNLTSKQALTFDAEGRSTKSNWSFGKNEIASDHSLSRCGTLDPVLDFAFDTEQKQLMSGTRKGNCKVWDLHTAKQIGTVRAAHRGPVTCLTRWSASIMVTGGQDGVVKVWDTRRGMPLVTQAVCCHVNPVQGTASAVSCLEKTGGLLATGGADKRVCLLDPRRNFQTLHVFDHHQAPIYTLRYAISAESPVLFSGAGDGTVHCVNLLSNAMLYGLHPTRGPVRALATTTHLQADKKLVAAGEDGKVVIFRF